MTTIFHEAVKLTRAGRLRIAYRDTYGSPQGRVVLDDLLFRGGVLRRCIVEGAPDASDFNEGRRSIALEIIDQLGWSEGALVEYARRQNEASLSEHEE